MNLELQSAEEGMAIAEMLEAFLERVCPWLGKNADRVGQGRGTHPLERDVEA